MSGTWGATMGATLLGHCVWIAVDLSTGGKYCKLILSSVVLGSTGIITDSHINFNYARNCSSSIARNFGNNSVFSVREIKF